MDIKSIKTIGELKKSGYRIRSVKDELRSNLIAKMQKNEEVFPGIIGFDETVIPEIQNAILSKHDFILLGLRGQAKSRILRGVINLLDPFIPIIEGSEINDNPFNPISRDSREKVQKFGDETGRFAADRTSGIKRAFSPDFSRNNQGTAEKSRR